MGGQSFLKYRAIGSCVKPACSYSSRAGACPLSPPVSTNAGLADPVQGDLGQPCPQAEALMVGVDRDHVDLADAGLVVELDGNEPGDEAFRLGDPDRGVLAAARVLHGTALIFTPIRVQLRINSGVAENVFQRSKHRFPRTQGQVDHCVFVLRLEPADRGRHGIERNTAWAGCVLRFIRAKMSVGTDESKT